MDFFARRGEHLWIGMQAYHSQRHLVVLVAFALIAAEREAWSQPVDIVITSAPNPVGSGARATGVGSAFIAIADDATAASWNPAGLVQLERPEISAVAIGTYQIDRVGTLFEDRGEEGSTKDVVGTDSVGAARLNYLSGAFPFAVRGRNVVLSLNYMEKLAFDRNLAFKKTEMFSGNTLLVDYDFEQEGSLYTFSPAFAFEVIPGLSLGAAVNFWMDGIGRSFAWRNTVREMRTLAGQDGSEVHELSRDTFRDFQGTNGRLGALWELYRGVSFGSFVELPFKANLDYRKFVDQSGRTVLLKESVTMKLPLSYGFGLSWRTNDRLVFSADVTRVQWDDFRIVDFTGKEFLVTADPADENHVDTVTTVRAGAEYLVFLRKLILAMRGGVFYDPEPSRGSPADFYGVSAGLGVTGANFSLDLAYQLRFGLDVGGVSVLREVFGLTRAGEIDVFQNAFYLSLVYYL